jgi:hypothetical protein
MSLSTVSSLVARFISCVIIFLIANVGLANDQAFQDVTFDSPGGKHQLWLVSTRNASSCPSVDQTRHIRYWRCDLSCQWRSSNLSEVLGSDDPRMTTLIYVHENRVTEAEAFQRAPIIFRQLTKFAPLEQRFRLIVITWPSDRIGHRPRPDVQVKAQRSEAHGFYLAWLLDQMHPDVPISLFGISYGPRLISAALHYLGGGTIDRRCLYPRTHPSRRAVRAVLMAPAIDSHWLCSGQRYGSALTQVEQMLITINPTDYALRWYPRMNGLLPKGANALGYVGFRNATTLRPNPGTITQWNVSGIVGSEHSWEVYEGSSIIMSRIAPYLFNTLASPSVVRFR